MDAVIVVVPAARAVSKPLRSTVATFSLLDFQLTIDAPVAPDGSSVAVSCIVLSTFTVASSLEIVIPVASSEVAVSSYNCATSAAVKALPKKEISSRSAPAPIQYFAMLAPRRIFVPSSGVISLLPVSSASKVARSSEPLDTVWLIF